MSTDDPTDDGEGTDEPDADPQEGGNVRERLEQEADKAVTGFDEGIVDMLSWVLETETRARIYVYLRQNPDSTSDEIAEGTGLYPSTVREALAELHDEGKVTRGKRENDGAGNNPYEYAAMAPSELVGNVVDDVQEELNTVFNLDEILGSDDDHPTVDSEPVTITVEDDPAADGDRDAEDGDAADEWGTAEDDDADEPSTDDADADDADGPGGDADDDGRGDE
ncbi:winged helix-turn-helix domain-containing protein [Halosimplex pelagicum]|uniref:Winged helix-turn-helix transcriptional regulator n=1 Tax=Halosimplex pelagicum TaxID=869886 RepID=A0A7D5PG96_9EURY|nr:winged helix-turn-helix domain-containing protein [Halosimplex pelagicum]QLH84160.1 winged helix-turn-helix transcriptional regulator [Halosimplex pelagicum]